MTNKNLIAALRALAGPVYDFNTKQKLTDEQVKDLGGKETEEETSRHTKKLDEAANALAQCWEKYELAVNEAINDAYSLTDADKGILQRIGYIGRSVCEGIDDDYADNEYEDDDYEEDEEEEDTEDDYA